MEKSVNTNEVKWLQFSKTVRYKWFSLIEMLIVMSIILILLVVFQNLFKPTNVRVYSWQKCVNDLYGFVNTFVNQWLTSKWFQSWTDMIYPTSYKTQMFPSQNKIINIINAGSTDIEQWVVNLSWVNSSQICYINSTYKIVLSWADIEIINKWSTNQFDISWSANNITWQTDLYLCRINNWGCIHIWEFGIDKRSQTITKRVCLGFSWNMTNFSWSDCSKWNQ